MLLTATRMEKEKCRVAAGAGNKQASPAGDDDESWKTGECWHCRLSYLNLLGHLEKPENTVRIPAEAGTNAVYKCVDCAAGKFSTAAIASGSIGTPPHLSYLSSLSLPPALSLFLPACKTGLNYVPLYLCMYIHINNGPSRLQQCLQSAKSKSSFTIQCESLT